MNKMDQSTAFSKVVNVVLADNTAQSVLNHLKALESNSTHVRTRWIWELLQNARDASLDSNGSLVASIEQSDNQITFRHNGAAFSLEEIAHLIYHGSTKVDSEEMIGQYGSGFLTTHLLSSEVNIYGQIEDGRCFDFRLIRKLGSVGELSESMRQATKDFEHSLSQRPANDGFTTEFRYPLSSDAQEVVAAGIEALTKCAPFIIAFNRAFSVIRINTPNFCRTFSVTDRNLLEQTRLESVVVSETEAGNQKVQEYLLAHGHMTSIAIPMQTVVDGQRCLPIEDTPKLFLGFPLIGTEDFAFPAVINSFRFTPTENRDGAHLGQSDNQANLDNQAAIEEASNLLISMIEYAGSSKWKDVYLLTAIPSIQQRDWLNTDWLRKHYREYLIPEIRQTPMLLSEEGPIAAEDAIIPFTENVPVDEGVEALWDILNGLTCFHKILPRRNESVGWCNSAESWARALNCDVSELKEVSDGRKLASHVEEASLDRDQEWGQVENLQALLRVNVDAIVWLSQFCGFLMNCGPDDVIRHRSIIPNQAGFLGTVSELHRDQAISEELKDIAESLEWTLRRELRDTRLTSLDDEVGAGERNTSYVCGELITRLRDRAHANLDEDFERASVSLFSWIVERENWNLLRDFPAFAEESETGATRIIKLRDDSGDGALPLAPIGAWEEDLQEFSELFPSRYILAAAFFESAPDLGIWQSLDEKGFLGRSVVTTLDRRIRKFLPDNPLSEDHDHEARECVTVTNIAFITREDVGIMARVRQSHRLAFLFWRFLTVWLVPRDIGGLVAEETSCNCGANHRYYSAEWLIPLVENKWVPRGERRADWATAKSLADLLRDNEWNYGSLTGNSAATKLLDAIGVGRFDLMRELVTRVDSVRTAVDGVFMDILAASGGKVDRLSQAHVYLTNLETDPDLPQVVEERMNRIRRVRENRRLGDQVENLVKHCLEDEGFVVRRTGIGSDFEIEYESAESDDLAKLELTRLERTWLVEVKATRDQLVRMTFTQAKTAVTEGDGFLLCVVPVSGEIIEQELGTIRDGMRFVADIGPRVAALCDDLEGFEELQEEITARESQGVQLEVTSGAARVRVTSSVWQDGGTPLAELARRLA